MTSSTSSPSSPPPSTTPTNDDDKTNNNKARAIAKKARIKARLKEVKGRLRREARKELKPIFIGTFAMLGSTLSNQALPRFLGKMLDQSSNTSTSSSKASSSFTSTSTSLALIVIGGGFSSFLRTTVLSRAQDNIASRLRAELFSKLMMERELEWFQHQRHRGDDDSDSEDGDEDDDQTTSPNSPTIINTILTDDIDTLSETITTTIANTFRSTCSVFFSTYHMLSLNPQLLGLSMSIVPIIGGAAVILNKFVKRVTARQHAITIKAGAFAQERIGKIATVKLSSREMLEVETYNKLQRKAQDMARSVTLARGGYMGFLFTATSGALVSVFHAGGRSVGNGRMSHGDLKSFVAYTFLLGLGTSGVMRGLGALGKGYVCAERVYRLMDDNGDDSKDVVAPTTTGKRNISSTDQETVHTISISDASFSYGTVSSTRDTQILKEVSLKIQRGHVVALVGSNGSGKSTLASLLVGLYRPQSGGVHVHSDNSDDMNAVDFYSMDRKTQSSLIQLVPQNPALFEMSIRDNVTYASPNATAEEVDQALASSNATDFIANLKHQSNGGGNGLEYNVGRDGCNLSAGQRQRLALARALLSDPQFLILDEPNTSLDAEGKIAVAEVVQACRDGGDRKKRGLLLITHRIESFQLADSIAVLKDGMIVEEGSYVELSSNKDSELCKLIPDLQ